MRDQSVDEIERIRREYTRRDHLFSQDSRYSFFNRANLFIHEQRTRAELNLLRQIGMENLSSKRILDVGCGSGGVLLEYLRFGASPKCLYGLDLIPLRLREAQQRLPHLSFTCADAQKIPFPDNHFDLILQFTMFSSILDDQIKRRIGEEILRVLSKPAGKIIWYDFWINPLNKQTSGIRTEEIRQLFPGCQFLFQRITLAPPIGRRLVPLSWILAEILEKLRFLNSHYLVAISPQSND